jgi:hypothetical protein
MRIKSLQSNVVNTSFWQPKRNAIVYTSFYAIKPFELVYLILNSTDDFIFYW